MAGNLPDARIVVRLDTQDALRKLDSLRKSATASGTTASGGAARSVKPPVPAARMSSDDEAGRRPTGSPAAAVDSAKKIFRTTKKVERTINKLDQYAGVAVAGVAAALVVADKTDPTGAIKKVLEGALDGLLRGSALISEVNARIDAAFSAINDVKEVAAALQLGGDQADPELLRQAGVASYEWAAVQQRRRAAADRFTRVAAGRAAGDFIAAATGGGR